MYPLAPDKMSQLFVKEKGGNCFTQVKSRARDTKLVECVTIRFLAFFLLYLRCTGTVPFLNKNISTLATE